MRIGKSIVRPALDRREFIGVAFATTAVSAMSLVPPGAAGATRPAQVLASDWSVDDQWSGLPRYAEAIGFGHPSVERPTVEPVDAPFVEF